MYEIFKPVKYNFWYLPETAFEQLHKLFFMRTKHTRIYNSKNKIYSILKITLTQFLLMTVKE